MTTTLDEALTRWTVICRRWQDIASGSQPVLGPFLAGWFLRDMGEDIDVGRKPGRDSFRAGWCEADTMINIRDRHNAEHHARSEAT